MGSMSVSAKKAVPAVDRLTPEGFKTAVKVKGWTYRALAERWHLSEVRISQIARDDDRPYYYDDAVAHLPVIEKIE
jgi:hypothetical protein